MNYILICIIILIILLISLCLICSNNTITENYNSKKIKIIQASPPHTASTVLVNYLHGYLTPEEPIHWEDDSYLIMKTHNVNIDKLIKKYSDYKCYFVVSERNDSKEKAMINQKYKKYDNVLIINYDEIKDTTNNDMLNNITNNLFAKFQKFIPINTSANKEEIKKNMSERIKNMNKKYEEIKNKPFSYHDKFYHIHGHHKNRK